MLHTLTPFADLNLLHTARGPLTFAAPRPAVFPGPTTQDLFDGTAGNDSFTGTAGEDGFDMAQGGNDTVKGKGDLDIFLFGAAFTAADKIDGGSDIDDPNPLGRDWLYLDGDYSAGVVFGVNTLVRVENISLMTGNSYNLTTHENTVAADDIIAIRGGSLGVGNDLTVDSTADTDGTTWVLAGAGHDLLTGGAGAELYTFTAATLQVTDRVNGGGWIDSLQLDGDFSAGFEFGKKTFKNIENFYLTSGSDYDLTVHDANVTAGSRMVVYGSPLDVGETLRFDGSAETDGRFLLLGGPASDVLIAGRGNDELQGGDGGDLLTPGAGNDDVLYFDAAESGGSRYDWIFGFDFEGADQFGVPFVPDAIDNKINSGSLSPLTFNADLVAAVNAGSLAADHAVLFTPDAGDLAGEKFLVVDANGSAGFQSGGVDWVVRLTDAKHLSSLDIADFFAI
jgi:Ca2+-binding RTX toxin-like protein